MSATYSQDPSTGNVDMVRFLIQDTNEDDFQFQNEEISAVLALNNDNVYLAAIVCVEALIAKYSGKATHKSVGDLSIAWGERSKSYNELLRTLQKKAALSGLLPPYAGGISEGDKLIDENDTDRVPPAFKRNSMQNTSF